MKSFNRSMLVSGVFNTSQTVQMANMVNFDSYRDFDPFTEAALRSDDAFRILNCLGWVLWDIMHI